MNALDGFGFTRALIFPYDELDFLPLRYLGGNAHAQRPGSGGAEMLYFFENFVLDPARRELRCGNALIAVQPQVFDLLEYLITNRDRVVSKDDILEAVWGGRTVSEFALTTRINATRAAVGDDGDQQRLIRTIPRKGIRFVGIVQGAGQGRYTRPLLPSPLRWKQQDEQRRARIKQNPRSAASSLSRHASYCSAPRTPEWTRRIYARSSEAIIAASLKRLVGTTDSSPTRTGTLRYSILAIPKRTRTIPSARFARRLTWSAAMAALKTPTPLQTRVGIATGLVVVGEMTDAGGAQERGIIGETPNIAAQLQALAEPNIVVIAESTRKLLGNLFDLQDLGTKDLKGIVGPVRAWAALRPSLAASRFEALHGSGLTDLVGREEELELLLRRWSRAKAGEGQVVLLSGEPGIGKSRLTAALLEAIASEPHTSVCAISARRSTPTAPFIPTIGQIERAAGFTRDDTSQAKLDKLDALLAQSATSPQRCGAFRRDAVGAQRWTLPGA